MGELSIKIRIGDRDYPMRVATADEERIRLAGRLVNERIKFYREQFGIDDKQDLLAMVAFDCLTDKMKQEQEHTDLNKTVFDKLSNIDQILANTLTD